MNLLKTVLRGAVGEDGVLDDASTMRVGSLCDDDEDSGMMVMLLLVLLLLSIVGWILQRRRKEKESADGFLHIKK